MASRRASRRAHPHLESPESRKKSNRKYRIASYGLTQDDFNLLLKIQGYACGMCRELFAEGQLIHVDHDHGCCPVKNRSCGKCVRGLLCHGRLRQPRGGDLVLSEQPWQLRERDAGGQAIAKPVDGSWAQDDGSQLISRATG